MLSALRRFGVSHALRASTPRAISSGLTPRALQWHPYSAASLQSAPKSLYHVSAPRFSASAEAQVQEAGAEESQQLAKFSDLLSKRLVDRRLIRTINYKMNIHEMTDVQKMTIEETLKGGDVLAQAKTGTGKTLAFLLPVVQSILKDPTLDLSRRSRTFANDIRAIIISPTRELAEQIGVEARRVSHGTGLQVQMAVGGTQKQQHLQYMRQHGCHILVGTPGRLHDLLSDPRSGVETPKLTSFVLDEADRLLDEGFSEAILEIEGLLPSRRDNDRQTLLFSATVPREVMSMVDRIMKPDYKFIRTVKDDEVPTHLAVPQKLAVLNGFENAMPTVLELAKGYMKTQGDKRPFKAIVYYNSTKEVQLAFEVFKGLVNEPGNIRSGHPLGRMPIFGLHSRLSQQKRSSQAQMFRSCDSGILFSSDVTARGMDFPDVTHVIQIGLARTKESYIHRLGRTGRANKSGEGWSLIHKHEQRAFDKSLEGLPIELDSSLTTPTVDMTDEARVKPPVAEENIAQIRDSMRNLYDDMKSEAYLAQMGTLQSFDDPRVMLQSMKDHAVHGYQLSVIPPTPSFVLKRGGKPAGKRRSNFRNDYSSRRNAGHRHSPHGRALNRESWERRGRGRASYYDF